jgi:hypothetical protein
MDCLNKKNFVFNLLHYNFKIIFSENFKNFFEITKEPRRKLSKLLGWYRKKL